MRCTHLAAALALFAGAAQAAPDALVIGNSRYDRLQTLFGAARVLESVQALQDRGVTVTAARDADSTAMRDAFAQFVGRLGPDSDPVLVVLAGAFVHGPGGSYLLPAQGDGPVDPASVLVAAFPIDSALTALARYPGRAVLVLGETVGSDSVGPYLQPGLGDLDIPQGVTVIRGAAPDVARFATDALPDPGRLLLEAAEDSELRVQGFAPRSFVYLTTEDVGPPARPNVADAMPAQEPGEQAADAQGEQTGVAAAPADPAARDTVAAEEGDADRPDPQTRDMASDMGSDAPEDGQETVVEDDSPETRQAGGDAAPADGADPSEQAETAQADPEMAADPTPEMSEADRAAAADDDAAWAAAQGDDTLDAYRAYLDSYPEGRNAAAARQRIAAIESEPYYAERRAEESLALGRDVRRAIQRDLTILDHDPQGIDGLFGPNTRAAIRTWQETEGLTPSGYLTADQIDRLDSAAEARAVALEQDARDRADQLARQEDSYWADTGRMGSEEGLRAYLLRYPDGKYAPQAREVLGQLERARRARATGQDRIDWERARNVDSISGYRRYLNERPGGAFVNEARARIRELQAQADRARQTLRARDEEASLGLDPLARRLAEARLDQLRLDPGVVDGQFDPATREAIARYQDARGLPVSGYLDQDTVVRLLADGVTGQAVADTGQN